MSTKDGNVPVDSESEAEEFGIALTMGKTMTPTDGAVGGAISKLKTLTIPEEKGLPSRSRSSSPVVRNYTQTDDVEYQISMQMTRLRLIQSAQQSSEQLTSYDISLPTANTRLSSLNELWRLFSTTHEGFAGKCSSSFPKHPYMKAQTFEQTFQAYSSAAEKLNELKYEIIQHEIARRPAQPQSPARHSLASLPKISLPIFDGQYNQWQAFKDMFNSLIINNAQLTDVERMHYLRSGLKGEAEKLVLNLPMNADSFDAAWALLTERYEVKRIMVSTQIEALLTIKKCSRSAHSLNALVTAVTQSLEALKALGSPVQHWDQLLVFIISSKLDDKTREEWEMQLGSSPDFPTFEQLREFIIGHARALERMETTQSKSYSAATSRATQPTRVHAATTTAAQSTPAQLSSTQYPCDQCKGSHFIVSCPKFRALDSTQRFAVVKQLRLCYNCLGHHSVSACRSVKRCTTCSLHHHTMLHSAPGSFGSFSNLAPRSSPAQRSSSEPSTSA